MHLLLVHKTTCFSNYHRSRHRFAFWTHCSKPLAQHHVHLCYFSLSQWPSLEKPLHSFTCCQTWSYMVLCFHALQTDDDQILCEAITQFRFATSKPPNYSKLWETISYVFPLASSTVFTHLESFWCNYNSLIPNVNIQRTPDVTESAVEGPVTDQTHLPLGLLTKSVSRLSAAGLKEFYCISFLLQRYYHDTTYTFQSKQQNNPF